jgi:hypothetical protein
MTMLVGAIAINSRIMPGIFNEILENNTYTGSPFIANIVYGLMVPFCAITILLAVICGVLVFFKTQKMGDFLYKLKKCNGILYNLITLSVLNLAIGVIEIIGVSQIALIFYAILIYGLFGYIMLDGLYKIVLKDIYMALKSEFIAHEVGL